MNRPKLRLNVEVLESRTTPSFSHFTPPATANPANAYAVSHVSEPAPGHSAYDFVLKHHGSTAAAIPAAENGTVVLAKSVRAEGRTVVVAYADGTAQLFAHLEKIDVRDHEKVTQGENLGIEGHTGPVSGLRASGNNVFTEIGHFDAKADLFVADRNVGQTDGFIDEYLSVLQKGGFHPRETPPKHGGFNSGGSIPQDGTSSPTFNTDATPTSPPIPDPTLGLNYGTLVTGTSVDNNFVDNTSFDGSSDNSGDCGCSDSGSTDSGSTDSGSSDSGN